MNKYEESFIAISLKVIPSSLFSLTENIDIVREACEKAERYDLIQENLTENHLTTDQEVEECNEYYIKQDAAEEIIEMIDAMCVDEKADVIWQSGAYIRNKYIAQKIKERYGIK